MNQSEFEENTLLNRHKARENACERGTIGFGLASYWLRKWRGFCQRNQSQSTVKQNQSRREMILSTLN